MSTEPLKKYLQAIEAYEEGKMDQAAQLIAESMGMEKPNEIISNPKSLKSLCSKQNPNIAVAALMAREMDK
jgi:hypothetical protein